MTFQQKSVIAQILGMVASDKGAVVGVPAENATRWIVDVFQDEPEITITLQHKYKLKPNLLHSFALAPLDSSFWGAAVHLEPIGNQIILRCSAPCRYRLAVDTVHSASR